MDKKIELLAPAGSLANLKAAVSQGADAVYLGMQRFSAREYATNFNEKFFSDAVKICKSNDVKSYITMNTLVKNSEIKSFFDQLSYAYSKGVDAVIIQEASFIDIIKKNYPDLKVHISTQQGVMNSLHANQLLSADRINLARELSKEEITSIRNNYSKELEIFCHGALCVSVSGKCLFSSFLGGRSGNRGRCAQPCRKKYNGNYLLSTKELCLLDQVPSIINMGIDSIKIEGRMRTPSYVAAATRAYREAIDSMYNGSFMVSDDSRKRLNDVFSREFTEGKFSGKEVFNRNKATGVSNVSFKEMYKVDVNDVKIDRKRVRVEIPSVAFKKSDGKQFFVRVYNKKDAIAACENGADVVYMDLFSDDFSDVKKEIKCPLFGTTPLIVTDKDIDEISSVVKEKNPAGLIVGNNGMIGSEVYVHLDYSLNCFNDLDVEYFQSKKALPVISPEMSFREISNFRNKNFAVFIHGKIRLMTLKHDVPLGKLIDEKKGEFEVKKIRNGCEIINGKELGLLSKTKQLVDMGVNKFFIDTDKNVGEIVKFYRSILDGKNIDDSKLKKKYILGWSFRGVL